jgi:hypothetical protein
VDVYSWCRTLEFDVSVDPLYWACSLLEVVGSDVYALVFLGARSIYFTL